MKKCIFLVLFLLLLFTVPASAQHAYIKSGVGLCPSGSAYTPLCYASAGGGNATWLGQVFFNNNAVVGPPGLSATDFRFQCKDSGGSDTCRIGMSGFGINSNPAFAARFARGTGASPSAAQSTDVLASFEGWGYGATGFNAAPKGWIRFIASEAWTDAAQGTEAHIGTTQNTTLTTTDGLVIDNTQHVRLGNTTVPTIAGGACGAGSNGAIVAGSNDHMFAITIGASATTTCAVTFGAAYTTAPRGCVMVPMNAAAAAVTTLAYSSAPTVSGWTLTGSVLASTNWQVWCE